MTMVRMMLLVAVVGACGGQMDWTAMSPQRTEIAVYTSTARFIIEYYQASERTGEPAAFCLVVGRREGVARRQRARESDRWDPARELLLNLSDLRTPVVPISECEWNNNLEEVHRPTGGRAVVLGISQPTWNREDFATVWVSTRENSTQYDRWSCNVRLHVGDWEVLDCL